MQNNNSDDQRVTFDALVRELLGLEPSILAGMDPSKRSAAAGLKAFLHRTLERALGTLWADSTVFRLRSDAAARAVDWPNAAICNLHTLLVWALSREPRRVRGRSDLPLLPTDPLVIELPQTYVARTTLSTGCLVAMARELLRTKGSFLTSGISKPQAVSIGALVEDMLGVRSGVLLSAVHELPSEDDQTLASQTDETSALAAWLMSVLDTSEAIIAQKIQTVGLVIVDEASDPAGARVSNLTSLFIAALLYDERDVTFFAQDAT